MAQNNGSIPFPEAPTAEHPNTRVALHIAARFNGWPVTIDLTIKPSQIGPYLDRLLELGYLPDAPAPAAPVTPHQAPAPVKRAPVFNGDGDPCCPIHTSTKLRPDARGRGMFCPRKVGDSFCTYTHSDDRAAA